MDLVSGDATWASPITSDSGLHVGLLDLVNLDPVSYTHLTLPTKLEV